MKRKPLIAGNWKLNILPSEVSKILIPLKEAKIENDVDV